MEIVQQARRIRRLPSRTLLRGAPWFDWLSLGFVERLQASGKVDGLVPDGVFRFN